MKERLNQLEQIYNKFAAASEGFRSSAACTKGCAFCCTEAGSIDITTLEGLQIQAAIAVMPRNRNAQIKKALAKEMKKREADAVLPCPFLQKKQGVHDL